MRAKRLIISLVVTVLLSLLSAGCRPTASQSAPGPGGQPASPRQFDVGAPYLPGIRYPQEILAMDEADLVPMGCTPDYFSWSGADHEAVDPQTQERHLLAGHQLETALAVARRAFPGKAILSLSLCERPASPSLVFFRIGPCGGGCAGIPTVGEVHDDATLSVLATVNPDGDGAYFSCLPLELTNDGLLYLSCVGEGTAVIRRLEISTGQLSAILRCRTEGTATCAAE
jgi:hypothetical protein